MFINEPSIVSYVVAGGVTQFTFKFKWFDETDINVYRVPVGEDPDDELHKLSPSDYVITSNASKVGGTVEVTIALTDGDIITIARVLPVTRTTDFAKRGNFSALGINTDQDYQSYLLLDLASYSNLFVRLPISGGDTGEPIRLPSPLSEAYIRWNLAGDALENDTEAPTWRVETEVFRDETEVFRDEALVSATDAQLEAWNSEAEALTADSFANQSEDVEVDRYTSDGDGSFTATPIPNTFSALHWSLKSGQSAIGLTFQDTWDASGGVYPTTRPPEGAGDPLEAGDLFIVDVGGNISGIDWFIADWMIRNVTNDGWVRVPQVVDWSAVINVPIGVTNGQVPIGGSIPYKGLVANIPPNWEIDLDMVDMFILGTATEGEIGDTGGIADAVNIEHNHTFSGTALPPHSHTTNADGYLGGSNYYGSDGGGVFTQTATVDATSAGIPSGTISTDGVSGIGLNLPPYVKRIWITRIS